MDALDKKTTRKSLPLSRRDVDDLGKMRVSAAYREVLHRLSGEVVSADSSEAAILRAVWEAGMRAVQEQVESEGYAQIAADMDATTGKAVARRRRPSWADEA